MCGIAGWAGTGDPAVAERNVRRAVDALAHRGPDANGTRRFPGLRSGVLGAVRLRIVDLSSSADQPLSNDEGSVCVAFNGELYNFRELRLKLEKAGHRFRTDGDTECLVHLYEESDGDISRMLPELRGMYAFAIWDTARQRLLLARDRLGIKPLLWTLVDGGIAFASEVRALARGGWLSGEVNPAAINEYLAWGSVPGDRTILAGAEKLRPGSFLLWEGGSPEITRWWSPFVRPQTELASFGSAQERLRAVLTDSVGRHLVAERTVGLFLSSGTDSTALATLAASQGAQRGITVTFPEHPALSEGDVAAETARELGITHEQVPVTGKDVADSLATFLSSLDQPTTDAFNTWLVCRSAKDAGLVVALSGLGGDELFGGYPTFSLAPKSQRLITLLSRLPFGARRSTAGLLSRWQPGGRAARLLMAPIGTTGAYGAVRRLYGDADLHRLGLGPAGDVAIPRYGEVGDSLTHLELTRFMADQLLPDTDSVSMAHSLEVRVPLIDDSVVDLCLAIPSAVRLAPQKQLLRAASGIAGAPIKRPFTMPFADWLKGPLCDAIRDGVCSDERPFGQLLPGAYRRSIWEAYERGRVHWSRPWALAVLRLWPEANGFMW